MLLVDKNNSSFDNTIVYFSDRRHQNEIKPKRYSGELELLNKNSNFVEWKHH
jgi:hypothetical protein